MNLAILYLGFLKYRNKSTDTKEGDISTKQVNLNYWKLLAIKALSLLTKLTKSNCYAKQPTNCLSLFNHFVGLSLKGLPKKFNNFFKKIFQTVSSAAKLWFKMLKMKFLFVKELCFISVLRVIEMFSFLEYRDRVARSSLKFS